MKELMLEVKNGDGEWVLLDDFKGPGPIDIDLAAELLELVATLWPKPGYSTVHVESHQWVRARNAMIKAAEKLARP